MIIICSQCNKKYIEEEDGLCDSCKDEAMNEFWQMETEMALHKLLKIKGRAYVANLINKYE